MTRRPVSLELPPDRAFVLQLAARAQLPRQMFARVEHVSSGQVTHVTSVRDLMAFLQEVLCTTVQEDDAAPAQLTRRGRSFDVEIPQHLEMVGDEAGRAEGDRPDTAFGQVREVIVDVGLQPRRAR